MTMATEGIHLLRGFAFAVAYPAFQEGRAQQQAQGQEGEENKADIAHQPLGAQGHQDEDEELGGKEGSRLEKPLAEADEGGWK